MKERIRQILEWTNLSQQDFANRLGISPASLSSIFTGRTNPTNNHVQAIHRSFPDINVNWLMFGEGHMMNSEEIVDRSLSGNDVVGGSDNVVSGGENREMASMFTEDDYRDAPMNDVYAHKSEDGYRQGYQGRPSGFQYLDNTKKNDKKMRKIKEIRVFFDDGTYEAFVPSTSK